jgi:hypothetical protein
MNKKGQMWEILHPVAMVVVSLFDKRGSEHRLAGKHIAMADDGLSVVRDADSDSCISGKR